MTIGQRFYREYLESDHWRNLRAAAFKRYGRRCCRCPSKVRLQVHHTRYRHPWESCTTDDLQILCRPCHEREHGIGTVKQPKHRKHKKRNWTKIAAEHSAMLDRQIQKRRNPKPKQWTKPQGQPKKKKHPKWWPGMYEGKAPYDTVKEVGTSVPDAPLMTRTPDCMNPKVNRHH